MDELGHFIKLSKFAGERFDLVQAAGGNSSVKMTDGTMLIKASGYLLSEVSEKSGYAIVNNTRLLALLEDPALLEIKEKKKLESACKEMVYQTMVHSQARPSIETVLHTLLHKYVLHTHPISVNAITCRSDWKEVLLKLFPECASVDYCTPGIELALGLKKELENYKAKNNKLPEIVFLQNHGLIVGSDKQENIYANYEKVTTSICSFLGIDLTRYGLTNKISALINSFDSGQRVAYLSEDKILYSFLENKKQLFFTAPFCPDTFVFCGTSPLEIKDLEDKGSINLYLEKYHDLPKVIVYKGYLFFMGIHLKKARETEEIFKFHLVTADASKDNIQPLPEAELKYLGNWEAEKYRQKL